MSEERVSTPYYQVRCRTRIQVRAMHGPLGTVSQAEKTYMTTMTELDDAAFDIKRDIERTLVLALVAEAWDIGLWPTGAPVLIWWEVWNAEARGSEGQPGAFVRYEWPQQNRE